MTDKSFGQFACALKATETIHLFVVSSVEAIHGILAGMRIASRPLAALRSGDVDVVSGVKVLGLSALINFEIIELELPAAAQPGVVNEVGNSPMITMTVDGPVSKDYVGLFGVQKASELLVPGGIHFCGTVDLPGEDRLGL